MAKISFGPIRDEIQKIRDKKGTGDAIKLANKYLASDPYNVEAYMQLIDMYYIRGELEKAEKPVDFILSNNLDAPGVDKGLLNYIKAVILSEKTKFNEAKKYIKKAVSINDSNLEYKRLLANIEFWSGNKEKAYKIIKPIVDKFYKDADILLDAVNMALSLGYNDDAKKIVKLYFDKHNEIKFLTKEKGYYERKMQIIKQVLFDE